MKLTFGEIKKLLSKHSLVHGDEVSVKRLCHDTRQIQPGDVFVAIRGENFDGHDFLEEAFTRGAVAAIVDRAGLKRENLIHTDDSIRALGKLASVYRQKFSKPVIAITGSSGKTTTKELLAHVLSQAGKVTATKGNLNNHIGVPLTIFSFDERSDWFVVELGMNHFGEIDYLTQILKPNMALITSVGAAHLEGVGGTIAGVAKAKGELFAALTPADTAFVFQDDENIRSLPTEAKRITYGFDSHNDVWASDVEVTPEKTSFLIHDQKKILDVVLNVAGHYHAQNALAVYVVAKHLGIADEKILKGFSSFKLTSGRGRVIRQGSTIFIDDTYNANPDSMKVSLKALVEQYPTFYKVAALGGMLELGARAKELHEEIGRYAKQTGIDALYAYGENASHYLKGFGYSVSEMSQHHFLDHGDMAKVVRQDIRGRESAVLVKGSRGMKMEKFLEHLNVIPSI